MTEEQFAALPLKKLGIEGNTGELKVGDRVRIRVEGVETGGAKVAVRTASRPQAEDQDASKTPKEPIVKDPLSEAGFLLLSDGSGTSPLSFEVVILRPGESELPSLAIVGSAGAEGDGSRPIARTEPLRLKAESAISESDLRPNEPVSLKDPVRLPYPKELAIAAVSAAVILFVAILYVIWRWLKKRAALRAAMVPKIPKTEDELALEKLDEIERAGFAAKGQYKKHYFGVSEALKIYVGSRYGFDAPEMTSEEIIERMKTSAFVSERLADRMGALFTSMDIVKFTDQIPRAEEPAEVLAEARRLIKETRRARMTSGMTGGITEGKNALR